MAITDLIGGARAQITIRLTGVTTEIVEVKWSTRAGTAIPDRDYVSNSGTAIFLPGETERKVDVIVKGRAITTEDRQFYLDLEAPTNAILDTQSVVCIIRVDIANSTPSLSLISLQGSRGLSAYEVAVQNGFVGTEPQWLKSLVDYAILTPLVIASLDIQQLASIITTTVSQDVNSRVTAHIHALTLAI